MNSARVEEICEKPRSDMSLEFTQAPAVAPRPVTRARAHSTPVRNSANPPRRRLRAAPAVQLLVGLRGGPSVRVKL